MPKCIEILNEVLNRTGLDRADGHPLYVYKVTSHELEMLRTELKNRLMVAGKFRTPEECAAFCLFGAEWFRRNYDSGPWSWQTIFDGLDCDARRQKRLKVSVGDCTFDGLYWWNVDVIATKFSSLYLTTLVCQGGFPLKTLSRDGAGLSRFLKACLKDHERYPSEPTNEIIQSYVHYLPNTLDNNEVRGLVKGLVEAIAGLRKQSDAADEVRLSRFDYLNKHQTGWEQKLPLRVDDPAAQSLLLALLDTARSQPFSHRAMAISTTLQFKSGSGFIARTLQFPSQLVDEDFRRLVGYHSEEPIAPRMTGILEAGDVRKSCVTLSRSHDGASIRLARRGDATLSGQQAFLASELVLSAGNKEQKRMSVPGGEALPDSPWVFSTDEPHQLIGVGSVRPRDASVLIAIPSDCDISVDPEATIRKREAKVAGRNVVELSGEAKIHMEDIEFLVRTKSEVEQAFLYELRGYGRQLGVRGENVWIGAPRVFQISVNEDEPTREVASNLVQWRSAQGGEWKAISYDCVGEVWIRVQEENETQYLAKVTVLPADFSFRVVPHGKESAGVLELCGLGSTSVYPSEQEGVKCEVESLAEKILVKVQLTAKQPSPLNLRFKFANGNQCDVSMVCPVSVIGIVNAVGAPFPSGQAVPVESMDGLRLQLIQPGSQTPFVFEAEFNRLIDEARETDSEGLWELPLSFIRDHAVGILSLSDHPNSEVEFKVRVGRAYRESYSFRVGRYAQALNKETCASLTLGGATLPSDQTTTVFLEHEVLDNDAENFAISVMPLGRPKQHVDPATVNEVSAGRWVIDHSSYPPGYYLAVVRQGLSESLRPLRFVIKTDLFNEELRDLEESRENFFDRILNIRNEEERRAGWDAFFCELADDYSHPGWARVDDLVKASYDLPVTTYEAVAALTRNPAAVARYGIFEPHEIRLWERLERLPFLWSLIPVQTWINAASRCRDHVRHALEGRGLGDTTISDWVARQPNKFAEEAPNRCPTMCCILMALWRAGFQFDPKYLNGTPDGGIKGLSLLDRQQEHARLLSQHTKYDTRDAWPEFKLEYSEQVAQILRETDDLLIKGSLKNQWVILNGPAVAAVYSAFGFPVTDALVKQFKRLRATDAEWYDKANAIATLMLMQRRYSENPNTYIVNES